MKTILNTCILSALLAPLALSQEGQQEPAIPVGSLSVNQGTVREGVKPVVSWNIDFPSTVEEVIDIDPDDDEITTKTKLRAEVSIIGVGITDQYGTEYPSKTWLHFSSSGWTHLFTGTGSQVNPTTLYADRILQQGERIRFASRVNLSGYNFYYNESDNVTVLKNGDLPPSVAGGHDQASIADYLGPYIKDGKLSLGPMDIIYAAELTHSDPSDRGYDIQDTIVLIRFTEIED